MYLVWGTFLFIASSKAWTTYTQCDRSLLEKSRQIVESTKTKMLLQMGIGPNVLEWMTKKKK